MSQPTVSVIMPVSNAALTLERAIQSILNQTYANVTQIILAIGPSDDSTMNVAQKCQLLDRRIHIIENDSGLTAIGLNKAATCATGDYLARVDSHCRIPDDYIARALKTITQTQAGNVGGIQNAVGITPYQIAVASAMSSRFGVGDSKFHYGGDEGPTDTVYLGFYDADLFYKLGGFDETLIRNQDYELNIRIRKAGRIVWFDPSLIVDYFPRSNFSGLTSQYFQYGKWKRKVIRKDLSSIKLRQIIPPMNFLSFAVGTILSIVLNPFFVIFPLIYICAVIIACSSIPRITIKDRLKLLLIFPTMHFSWAIGFLFGVR